VGSQRRREHFRYERGAEREIVGAGPTQSVAAIEMRSIGRSYRHLRG
jgi:hypothetical protein